MRFMPLSHGRKHLTAQSGIDCFSAGMIPVYLAKDETANPLVMDVLICQVVQ
jgi:hypothetical protein